jgi:phosphoserine phosphatase
MPAPGDPTAPPPAVDIAKMRELLDVSRQLAVTSDLDHLLPLICHAATRMIGADRCSLFLHDPAADQLWTKVALGASEIRVPASAGIVGLVFNSRQMLVIPDAYADVRFNRAIDVKTGYTTRNLLTIPVFDLAGEPVAVLQVVNKLTEGGAFGPTDEMLARLLADQAGVAIQRFHLQQRALEAVAMQREMDLARRVQENLIPKSPPQIPGLRVAGWNRPASTTGGDAYDLWQTNDGRLAIFVADATGHGIAPALVVSQARALVRVLADDAFDPTQILSRVNNRLAQDLESGMFVTAFLGLLNADGRLDWSSAGHGPVLVRRGPGSPIEELAAPAPPLGVVDEFLTDPSSAVTLEPGGWLAVITDGVSESWSPDKDLFGDDRLKACLEAHACKGPHGLIDSLRHCLSDWQKTREPSDDQTIVFVSRD